MAGGYNTKNRGFLKSQWVGASKVIRKNSYREVDWGHIRNEEVGMIRFTMVFLCLLVSVIGGQTARAETVYFVVGEVYPYWGDSYILPLSNPMDIAHARYLIEYGPNMPENIVVAEIEYTNPMGINRNFYFEGKPAWSWQVSNFISFADITAEILDGSPTQVEEGIFSGGVIGFWNYTVTQELGTDLEPWNCDLSGDRCVDIQDLVLLVQRWLDNVHWGPDVNGNNKVDLPDFAIMAKHWLWQGTPYPPR